MGLLAAAQPEEIRARRSNAEQAYTNVLSRLGAAGTYGSEAAEDIGEPMDLTGTFTKEKVGLDKTFSGKHTPDEASKATSYQINLPEYQQKVEGSTQFRLMSKLTAEAEQLVNREGPLYDEMMNNLQLPIFEGSAALARENTEVLRKAMQKGGAARRGAFEAVQKIRAQERINSAKTQALAQTRFQLDTWSRENARDVLSFGQNWASNLGGIRETYQQAMDRAAELMTSSALPVAASMYTQSDQAKAGAFAAKQAIHQAKRAKTGKIIMGVVAVASMVMGGIGAVGLLGAAGAAGGAAGAAGATTVATAGGAITSAFPSAAASVGTFGRLAGTLAPHAGSLLKTGIQAGTSLLDTGGGGESEGDSLLRLLRNR